MLCMPHELRHIMYENLAAQCLARHLIHDNYNQLIQCAREEQHRGETNSTFALEAETCINKRPPCHQEATGTDIIKIQTIHLAGSYIGLLAWS